MVDQRCGLIVVLIGVLLYVNGEFGFCVTKNNVTISIGKEWQDERGCSCTCVSTGNYTFSECGKCPSAKSGKSINNLNMCKINGWTYSGNDRWLSTEKECSLCRCGDYNIPICDNTKDCINPCDDGQKPKFGPCCQVEHCKGNATVFQQTRNCQINDRILHHGKSIVLKSHCTDRFCTCNNGAVQCFEYCELIQDDFHLFWNKLCCPRRIGNKSCDGFNSSAGGYGDIVPTPGEQCKCLDGEIYCSKVFMHNSKVITTSEEPISSITEAPNTTTSKESLSSTTEVTGQYSSSTVGLNVTDFHGLTDTTMKELFIILCLFCIVILVLLAIVFVIRLRYRSKQFTRHRIPQDDNTDFESINEENRHFDQV